VLFSEDRFAYATVVDDDAIRFVSEKSNEKLKSSSSSSDENYKESNEPDYDEDEDQRYEKQEEETTKCFNEYYVCNFFFLFNIIAAWYFSNAYALCSCCYYHIMS
jgi:hypothetical protein